MGACGVYVGYHVEVLQFDLDVDGSLVVLNCFLSAPQLASDVSSPLEHQWVTWVTLQS